MEESPPSGAYIIAAASVADSGGCRKKFSLESCELVGRVSSVPRCLHKDALKNEIINIAVGRILRAMVNLVPFRRSELALKPIQQHIDGPALAVIK